jgi:hypothetical protein
LAAAVPVVLAAIELSMVNRWMTGSPFRSPYVYGDTAYQSVDLLHPQFSAVLVHPWRGLLVYHPLYGIAFVAVLIVWWRNRHWRGLWGSTVCAVLLHLWVQSAWHIWWLGGSFGMRGLAPAALPMMVALVATIARSLEGSPREALWWLRVSLVACAWSFVLLLHADGDNLHFTWSELAAARMPAAAAAVAIPGAVWALLTVCRVRWNTPPVSTEAGWSGLLLLAAAAGYLVVRTEGRLSTTLLLIAAASAAGIISFERLFAGWHALLLNAAYVAAVALFAAQAMIFTRLADRTERYLASGSPPPRQFRSVGTVSLDDLRQSYREYITIPGFEDRKEKLLRYLDRLEVDSARNTPGR